MLSKNETVLQAFVGMSVELSFLILKLIVFVAGIQFFKYFCPFYPEFKLLL